MIYALYIEQKITISILILHTINPLPHPNTNHDN